LNAVVPRARAGRFGLNLFGRRWNRPRRSAPHSDLVRGSFLAHFYREFLS